MIMRVQSKLNQEQNNINPGKEFAAPEWRDEVADFDCVSARRTSMSS